MIELAPSESGAEQALQIKIENLERRVLHQKEQLDSLNQELESFTYSVSHDLKAPLRSIRGLADVLSERYGENLDQTGRDFLRRICESGHHMSELVENLAKLSRISRSELVCQSVNLTALAESSVIALRKHEPERRIDVTIQPGLQAWGDERLLRLALDSLFQNAWKFTNRQTQPAIEFKSTTDPEPAFLLSDNGAGFEMEYAARLFGAFQRLHSASEFPGTGMGLATVRRIINRHGGRIWARGEVNRGASIYFTLPNDADG